MSVYLPIHSNKLGEFDIEMPTKISIYLLLKITVIYSGTINNSVLYFPYLL